MSELSKRELLAGMAMQGLSDLQVNWIQRLREQGFRVEVCYGYKEVVAVVEGYLNS